MPEINLVFELKDKKSAPEIATSLQDRIAEMEMVDDVEAVVESSDKMRVITGLEIVAAIGVTVTVIKSGRELLEEVREFIKAVKGLMVDVKDLKNAYVDIGSRRVPLDKLGPDDLAQIAGKK